LGSAIPDAAAGDDGVDHGRVGDPLEQVWSRKSKS